MKPLASTFKNIAKDLSEQINAKQYPGLLIAHFDLFQKTNNLQGSIVNCGFASADHFTSFSVVKNMLGFGFPQTQVAFEKQKRTLYFENTQSQNGVLHYKTENIGFNKIAVKEKLNKHGIGGDIEFVSGYVSDAIPQYLIENPELKIAFPTINLDDYEGTMTALQFLYPRLVAGGVLVVDNFYKNEDDYMAICDYFSYENLLLKSHDKKQQTHFIVKEQ